MFLSKKSFFIFKIYFFSITFCHFFIFLYLLQVYFAYKNSPRQVSTKTRSYLEHISLYTLYSCSFYFYKKTIFPYLWNGQFPYFNIITPLPYRCFSRFPAYIPSIFSYSIMAKNLSTNSLDTIPVLKN